MTQDAAKIKLPRVISDGMVLQRNTKVKIWGQAPAGEGITVQFINNTYRTAADEKGEWQVDIPTENAGGPYEMLFRTEDGNESVTIKNILLGEVWLCSGQSNMAMHMLGVKDAFPEEVAKASNAYIRQFSIPEKYSFDQPQADFEEGCWEAANPDTVLGFTAAGYFFAKELYEQYQVPVGLLSASLGGSPAEAWLSKEAIAEFPEYKEAAQRVKDPSYVEAVLKENQEVFEEWHRRADQKDIGIPKEDKGKAFYAEDYEPSGWSELWLPCFWEEEGLGYLNGVVWFRKEVQLSAELLKKPAKIIFGQVIDEDTVYINGIKVGSTPFQYAPRRYDIPEGVLKEGRNVITVRVVNVSGDGGFYKDKPYQLVFDGESIDISGRWQCKVGYQSEPMPTPVFIPWQPSGLFNAMIAPITRYVVKGAIWYQGETNAQKPENYERLLKALITDWRKQWKQADYPFLLVQLPNFKEPKHSPAAAKWPDIREAQRRALSVPGTALAVTIDIGECNDVHPVNKKELGRRLALAARNSVYGEKELVAFGPMYQSVRKDGSRMRISFQNTGGGLTTRDGRQPGHFEIAGLDKRFMPASAELLDNKVVVWSELLEDPAYVRYAWADQPEGANLYNREGLPASPFTTE